jgi:RNA polymerase sigma factor (sigma-70 family)
VGTLHEGSPPFLPVVAHLVSGKMRKSDRWCILAALPSTEAQGVLRAYVPLAPYPLMPLPSDILLEHLSLVERIIATICRGRGMDAAQTEEFAGFVKLRLVENDYAIVRAFKERSSFGTYMTTVVSRLLSDYRNHEWGKWHDSAEAKRLGNLAVDLERMIVRDSRSIDEALAVLGSKYPGVTRATLADIAARFPQRHRRRMVSLHDRPESTAVLEPEDAVANAQLAECISRVVTVFVRGLSRDDQLLFQLRFTCDMPVPQIANVLHQDLQALYRRLRMHMGSLRAALQNAGVSAKDVSGLIGSDTAIFDFDLKSEGGRPSNGADPGAAPEEDA